MLKRDGELKKRKDIVGCISMSRLVRYTCGLKTETTTRTDLEKVHDYIISVKIPPRPPEPDSIEFRRVKGG